jgi:hypothetical protein
MRQFDKPSDVLILNVTAILAQMNRDAVGSSQMGLNSGPNRIGFIGAPSLPDCCDVINIYAEFNHGFLSQFAPIQDDSLIHPLLTRSLDAAYSTLSLPGAQTAFYGYAVRGLRGDDSKSAASVA